MASDPSQLLLHLANAPGLAAQSVFQGANDEIGRQQAQQQMQFNGLKMQMLQQQQGQEEAFQTATSAYLTDPTPANLSSLMARFPDKADALKKSWDVKDDAVRRADMGQFGAIYAALSNNKADLAIAQLRQRRDAEKAKGIDTSELDHYLEALATGDKDAINAVKGFALAQIAAGDRDKFSEIYKTVGGDRGTKVVAAGGALVDEQGNELYKAPFAPRPVTVGEGQTVVEYQPGTEGGGPASGGGSSGGAAQALQTNPGALKDGPFARSQPGYTGTSGGFATFETEAQGRSAQMRLLDKNYIQKGFNTPRKIVERYAPRGGENSDASVNNYASYIAGKLGIGVDDAISSKDVPRLARAMGEFETGNRPGGQAAGPRVIAQGAPKPGYQLMTPAENEAAGLDPNVRYQRAPDGQITALGGQSKAQLKAVPPPIVTKVLDNRKAVRNIDGALAEIKKYPDGVGFLIGNTPNWIAQRTDKKGVEVRSAIANIGSLIIHDRSGAAVTVSETPRLLPFIPLTSDTAETAKKKLKRLRAEIASLNEDYEAQYSEDQGYKPIAASPAPRRVRSIQEAQKLAPGTIYIAPDGKKRRR